MKTVITLRADDSERLALLALVGTLVGIALGVWVA